MTKTKTKIVRPRPKLQDQDQDQLSNSITARIHNRKKLLCCNTHACYQKITWCKIINKVMTSNVRHCFCTYCTKEHRCILHVSIIVSRAQQCWKQDQKYKTKTKAARPRKRPRPRPVWDWSCHKPWSQAPRLYPRQVSALASAPVKTVDIDSYLTAVNQSDVYRRTCRDCRCRQCCLCSSAIWLASTWPISRCSLSHSCLSCFMLVCHDVAWTRKAEKAWRKFYT